MNHEKHEKHEKMGKGLVPQLRFPEFRNKGEWEEKEVGEVFKVTRGEVLAMSLVNDEQTEDTPYPVYSSQTKNVGLAGYYSEYLYEDAITWTTDGANAGDVNYRPGKFFCTNVCGVLISDKEYANLCTAALINSVSRQHVSYVGNPKLMNGVMAKIRVAFPSLPEQQKIADCLSSLDDLIAAEGRKLAALRDHKKGLMQQLFPREGETRPRLRFPEFRDAREWEEKKFGEIITLDYGSPLPEQKRRAGRVPVIGSNGIVGYHDEAIVKGPAIVIGRKGSAGQVNWIQSDCYPIDTTFFVKNLDDESLAFNFLWRLIESINLEKLADTGAVPGLNRNEVYVLKTYIPSRAEQQKIADCLSALDALIDAQAKKLDALRTHKRGLMQQLFPSPEGAGA